MSITNTDDTVYSKLDLKKKKTEKDVKILNTLKI